MNDLLMNYRRNAMALFLLHEKRQMLLEILHGNLQTVAAILIQTKSGFNSSKSFTRL